MAFQKCIKCYGFVNMFFLTKIGCKITKTGNSIFAKLSQRDFKNMKSKLKNLRFVHVFEIKNFSFFY